MTQQPNVTRQKTFWGQRFLIRRLSYLSGVGILGSGAAIAQAPSNVPPVIISAPSSSQSASPASALSNERLSSTTLGAAALALPERSAPADQVQIDVQPTQTSPAVTPPSESYEAPSTIVITNRSSGCEITLNQGQAIADGSCGSQRPVASASVRRNIGAIGGEVESVQVSATPTIRSFSSSPEASVTTAAAPAYSFVKDYYNRTIRPLGRPGNGNLRLMFPLSIPVEITSIFGWRIHPISGDARFHAGTDLGAPMGTPVLAALAGRVVLADFFGGYGLAIALEHDNGKQQTLYGHLSEIFVKPGEAVKQGTVIARSGSTGNSTGPHLHFEFRQLTTEGWVAQDPGVQLESALAQLVKSLQTAQKAPVQPSNGKS
ncbi:M23 family peptidase [Phormidesmis priestleyi ULC007]|uniref:M23 family peptidase n=1 Tax=Phormidesmis priestleyi ULC007 TaxID=1920490 RepID=A0A2T1DGU1_9CYAN|nr:M23 family metallopeptidase [Phormidesmis priestleyi]PSB19712.1 M23 family peptidase [Phormidesmis priestleyi ULC007]PZO53596.1 MAG: M23 family peptidase [Phormidesmis priestleyi]